jgi:DNA-binding CsgD family transcriptional regulator
VAGTVLCLTRLGHVAHAEGNLAEARALYQRALAQLRRWDDKRSMTTVLINLALVDLDAADLAAARTRLEEAAAAAGRLQDPVTAALCLDGVAGLAAARARPEVALRLAGAAAGVRRAIGASHPRNLREWAERSLAPARRAVGEDDRAALWAEGQALSLEQALATAVDFLGAPAAGAAPGHPGPSGRRRLPGSLTAREAEVLRHVAAGQSDRQIAAALVLSEGTVGRHLANIYTKLGVSSRAAATAFALRNDLA